MSRRIPDLVAATQRSLTVDDFREAFNVKPGNTGRNPSKLINNIKNLIECCGSLLTIDEELQSAQFPHSSIKQHMLSQPTDSDTREYHIGKNEANVTLGKICVAYLNLDILSQNTAIY